MDDFEAIPLRVTENFTRSSHLIQIELLAILGWFVSKNAPGKNASEIIIVSSCDSLIGYHRLRIGVDHDVMLKIIEK